MRLAAALVLALAASTGAAQEFERRERPRYADPSAVIAADLALSRRAREVGEHEALREAAAPQAVLFVPRRVEAQQWLKRQPKRAAATQWQPRSVWTSCDGNFAVSRGAWRQSAAGGDYISLWQRQPKDGAWRWLLRERVPAAEDGEVPDLIAGNVAECSGLVRPPRGPLPPPVDAANGVSFDKSLEWTVHVGSDCALSLTARAWNGRAMGIVTQLRRAAPAGGCG